MTPDHNILVVRPVQTLRRAFSLVELLLAIFILGIGVIAVAAIFPAGIAQQQQSNDEVLGPVVAQHALGVIRSKLDQEDFGTFEQFGIYLDDLNNTGQPELPSEQFASPPVENFAPGDWTWMRPSYILRGGIFTPTPNLNPDPMHGAIDVFGLRFTRNAESMSALPEANEGVSTTGFGSAGSLYATSDFAPPSPTPTGLDIGQPDFSQGAYEGAQRLYGIPYNRNRYAMLDPYNPGNFNGNYAFNPTREGRDEPLVTIMQSERTWPQNTEDPQYVWDCMFRRYQGRVQVAIFVYRVSRSAGEKSPYAVSSGYGSFDVTSPSAQNILESPLPARVVLDGNSQWSPVGADAANPRDDLDVPGTAGTGSVFDEVDPYGEGWQAPGQWILDQNGNIHRVLAGRRSKRDGPVRLARPVPHVARHAANGNLYSANGNNPSTVDEASQVKAVWFIPPESRDGMILTPVFVTVRDL